MNRYSDRGDKFRNPILFADYSDPDVIRVGDTYYMTASSFNYTPGLPILVSQDLVNWELKNYALENIGQERFKIPRHSEGVWAPAIRFHEGMFYIYYGMPDEGYYVVRTKDPLGKWEEPVCVLPGKGLIDSCPIWDDDGRAYIVHGYAKSRIGFKSILGIFEMSPDGLKAISEDHFIFNGNDPEHPAITIEGPKVYKRNGYYYIWAPAGGVREGYQVVLRSRDIHGPYEIKKVMDKGSTVINGPHQGGLVDTNTGDEWFVHFQDRGLYGRICHLQPVTWDGDWPVVSVNKHDEGWGEPVYELQKPASSRESAAKTVVMSGSDSDDLSSADISVSGSKSDPFDYQALSTDLFEDGKYNLSWQWLGDHEDGFYGKADGERGLRLFCKNPSGEKEPVIWRSSNVLTQKIVYPVFEARIRADVSGLFDGDRAGVCMTGGQYVTAYIERDSDKYILKVAESEGGDSDKREVIKSETDLFELLREDERCADSSSHILKNLEFVMTFDLDGRDFPSEKLYFQDVKHPLGGKDPSLKISLGVTFDEDGAEEHSAQSRRDLGISYTPSDHTWVGAKIGIYALAGGENSSNGYADFKEVIVSEL